MELNFTNLTWSDKMQLGAALFGVLSIITFIFYFLRLLFVKNLVKRYEFMSANEIGYYKAATVLFAIGLAMLFNSFIAGLFNTSFSFAIGLFLSGIVGVVFGYALFAYFDVYYPFTLDKRLSKIRFKTRVNPQNGKPMRLLNEQEEDVHLTEDQLKDEKSFAFDYDVWIDDSTGFKLIERYDGHLYALECEECNFRTLKEVKEEIIKSPSYEDKGMLLKHFKCSNCGHKAYKEVSIAPLSYERDIHQQTFTRPEVKA